ncbi:unnamed protein product [Cyclocybe aegerita]|uniref:Retrotransposon gag domain-containing protein n=1 Tax=Cyclocybe aegerita TaxID=1973307 RepID=A0A8S0W0F1_CYCAE|nr:unnamed protein product [Cyclocybe aegerita]
MATRITRAKAKGTSSTTENPSSTREPVRSSAPQGLARLEQDSVAIGDEERLGNRVPEERPRGQADQREDNDESRGRNDRRHLRCRYQNNENVSDELRMAIEAVVETRDGVERILRAVRSEKDRRRAIDSNTEEIPRHGPSTASKGKGIDPTNWGNVDIPEDELDIHTQQVMLEDVLENGQEVTHQISEETHEEPAEHQYVDLRAEYQKAKEHTKALREKIKASFQTASAQNNRETPEQPVQANETTPAPTRGISTTPMSRGLERAITKVGQQARTHAARAEALKPANQLPQDSVLGQFFARQGGGGGGNDPFDSDSSDDEDLPRGPHFPPTNRQPPKISGPVVPDIAGKAVSTRTVYRQPNPTEPSKYYGDENIDKYMQFVQDFEQYCKEAGIPEEDQVIKCGHFLGGKARSFYSTMVALNVHEWDLPNFLRELFNWCFPPDFRLKQRKKLENFRQGGMLVSEYAHKLDMLFRIVGASICTVARGT